MLDQLVKNQIQICDLAGGGLNKAWNFIWNPLSFTNTSEKQLLDNEHPRCPWPSGFPTLWNERNRLSNSARNDTFLSLLLS